MVGVGSVRSILFPVLATITTAAVGAVLLPLPLRAETLEDAMTYGYRSNPQLNAERAALRATDEFVPQALSDYRPKVNATADIGVDAVDERGARGERRTQTLAPRGAALSASQTLFNGFQTGNRVRAAESRVLAGRESLRLMEQTVLLDIVTAYMDVLRDGAVYELQTRNVDVLREQLEQARTRLRAGQVTPTDVAQAQSRQAAAVAQLLAAQVARDAARANYERIVGRAPEGLTPGRPVDRLSPRSMAIAIGEGETRHPAVVAAGFGADVATLQIKIAEGALYPTATLEGVVRYRVDTSPATEVTAPASGTSASLIARLAVPLFQGGGEYAAIRQAREQVTQRRFDLEALRRRSRATVVQSWGLLEAAKAAIEAANVQVSAAETAFNGVREEARAGQRTTLDLLNAQQELVNARVALATAQRNRVVASYTLLAAVGRLSPQALGLPVEIYDPSVHYHQVRDSWIGLRTPDGN